MIIYKTTNLVNGKIYVGQDSKNNPEYLGSGIKLRRAISKYGKHNFKKEVLEECMGFEQLNSREIFWINELKSTDNKIGYNLTEGGTGGDTYSLLTNDQKLETIRKRRKTLQQKSPEEKEKSRIKHSEAAARLWSDPKHKENIKNVMTGREISWKDKIGEANKKLWIEHGDRRSEETRSRAAKLIGEKMRGFEFKSVSEELQTKIVALYQTMGPKLIEKETGVSRYLVIRILKKHGIYQRFKKGIGPTESKLCSTSRKGEGNPMFGRRK